MRKKEEETENKDNGDNWDDESLRDDEPVVNVKWRNELVATERKGRERLRVLGRRILQAKQADEQIEFEVGVLHYFSVLSKQLNDDPEFRTMTAELNKVVSRHERPPPELRPIRMDAPIPDICVAALASVLVNNALTTMGHLSEEQFKQLINDVDRGDAEGNA